MSKESQKEFYTTQRLKAEKSGDTKTTTKINDKLNAAKYDKSSELAAAKKSTTPSADADDKAAANKSMDAQDVASKAERGGRDFMEKYFGGKF
jgi:hypothetical protein